MKNTVLVESKLRNKLKLACALLCVFSVCFVAVLVCVFQIGSKTLSGQTETVSGVLTEAYVEDSNAVIIDGTKRYNVVWSDKDHNIDLKNYVGKAVTLTVTRETFASDPWALGLSVDGQTLVDYNQTLKLKMAENDEIKTVIIAVTATICALTCGAFIWRFNVRPFAEKELYGEFAEFIAPRQPTCKERKISLIIYLTVYIALVFALLITVIALDPESETIAELAPNAKAVLWALLAVLVVGLVGLFALLAWLKHREIAFYAQNFPFDYCDISHAPLRKKVKEELQAEVLKNRLEHPDVYADGGNGFDVTFGEQGVKLSVPLDDFEMGERVFDKEMPDAEEVFEGVERVKEQDETKTDAEELFLSYAELNFEAVAHYRNGARPMIIIVKSRLGERDDLPEGFVNDIHLPFDLNLQKTLKKFNVKVENLDYLLDSKKRLMTENCRIFRKNKDAIAK